MNLSGKNDASTSSTVPAAMNSVRRPADERIISAATPSSASPADYSLSKPTAANVSVDASLSPLASSSPVTSAGNAEQNNTPAIQPATSESSYQNSGAPVAQSSSSENFFPASSGTPVYQSSPAGFPSYASGSVSSFQSSGSALAPASSSLSSDQPSSRTSASRTASLPLSSQIGSGDEIPGAIGGQTNLDVTDFGASSDVQEFFVSTVSNSYVVSVTGTNMFSSSDVGKVIEVFGAGPWVTYSNWGPVVTQQDIICTITNVSDGTNLTLTIPCGWTTNAFCVVGTNNAPAFQAAINEASNLVQTAGYTNVTINIPGGTYLMVSPYVLDPSYTMYSISDSHPALTISSGGITLLGDPSGDSILLGCGAGMNHLVATSLTWISPGYAPYVPMRDTLVWCAGAVQNNEYPLVFQNLTLDGGVQNGALSYNYWTIIQGNGQGWDTTHHAVGDWDGYVTAQMNMIKVFTNCVFQHWRGEMLIGWTANMPGATEDIANCTFYDGNATADNMNFGQHIHGCTFNQIEKVTEFYQYNSDSPTLFEDNLITNIAGNELVINGATTNAVPPYFTICNNTFYGSPNLNDIVFVPACNVIVSNNQFYGQAEGISFNAVGLQPSDGSAAVMSNFVIVANNFHDTFIPIVTDGYPVEDVTVADNTGTGNQQFVIAGGGWKTNWFFSNNSSPGAVMDSSQVQAGSYFVDDTSDNLGWYTYNDYTGGTNGISYGDGTRHLILHAMTNSVFVFDSNTNLLPAGAVITIDNTSAQPVPLYVNAVDPSNNNNNSNNNQTNNDPTNVVTLQTLGQMYKANVSFDTFFEALFSLLFSQSLNSENINSANVNAPAASVSAISVPGDSSSGPVIIGAGQTVTFVWNNGVWQEQ